MTKIEERLRSELHRSASAQAVIESPSVDELTTVAHGRQQRNRVLGFGGLFVVLGALVVFSIFGNNPSTVEVAGVDDAAVQTPSVEEALVAPAEETGGGEASNDQATAVPEDVEPAVQDDQDAEIAEPETSLQAVEVPAVEVETRASAVEIAGGSGVLVAPTGDGGYAGLAMRFGGDGLVVGLSSSNGLDWTEVPVTGIPNDATASRLSQFDGTYVALFESFSADTGRQVLIGTSVDLSTWDVSAPLAGSPIPVDLAVGEAGVVVVGTDGQTWVGPIGGPYEPAARLAALSVSGVTTTGNEFLVAGQSSEGAALFRSTNGEEWTAAALSSPTLPGSTPVILVDQGTIVLSNAVGGGDVSLVSTDGGVTWEEIGIASQEISVSARTLGVLSLSNVEPSVGISDTDSLAVDQIGLESQGRLALVAAGDDEVVLIETTESGTNWIVARR